MCGSPLWVDVGARWREWPVRLMFRRLIRCIEAGDMETSGVNELGGPFNDIAIVQRIMEQRQGKVICQ